MSYKIIVAGGRDFADYEKLKQKLNYLFQNEPYCFTDDIEIVSGTARGADQLGERYAQECHMPIKRFPADWDLYGKRAGYIRNEQMAKYADSCVVFWDGKSKGTKMMIDLAIQYKLALMIIGY